MIAACSKASVHPPTTVATIEANARDSGATISLFELARAGNHRLEPVPAGGVRPVRILQVLAVDVYLIEGDRGREEVRVTCPRNRYHMLCESWHLSQGVEVGCLEGQA